MKELEQSRSYLPAQQNNSISSINNVTCPSCDAVPANNHREKVITCHHCGVSYYRWTPPPLPINPNIGILTHRTFEKLILLSENELRMGNYSDALAHCKAALDIGFDTGVTWDYMAMCEYLNSTKEDIVATRAHRIIELLRTGRSVRVPSESSDTGLVISTDLFYHVKRLYDKVAINKNRDNAAKLKEKRTKIVKYLRAWKASYEIYPNPIYLEHIEQELRGNHKMVWLELNLAGELQNTESSKAVQFDTLGELKYIVEKNTSSADQAQERWRSVQDNIRRKLAGDRHQKVLSEYRAIRKMKDKETSLSNWTMDDARKIKSCLVQWKMCHKVSQNSYHLENALEELSGEGKLFWLNLDSIGNLRNNDFTAELNFDAFLMFQEMHYLAHGQQQDNYEGYLVNSVAIIKKNLAERLFNESVEKYNLIEPQLVNENKPLFARIKSIKSLIDSWKSYYNATGDIEYLRSAITELSGNGKILWFSLDEDGDLRMNDYIDDKSPLCICDICDEIDFNPLEELRKMIQVAMIEEQDKKASYELIESEIKRELSDKLFERANVRYATIYGVAGGSDRTRWNLEDWKELIDILKAWEKCFKAAPEKRFLETLIQELSGYGKLGIYWVQHPNLSTVENSIPAKQLQYDAIRKREQAIDLMQLYYDSFYHGPELQLTSFVERIKLGMRRWFVKDK